MIRSIIVDDELHGREELAVLLEETGKFTILDSCVNAFDALKSIRKYRPQLLFLDIEMPVVGGFELLAMIDEEIMPYVVFVTAYDEYALQAFEEKTLDYLLKPIDLKRLDKMVDKVISAIKTDSRPFIPDGLLSRVPCYIGTTVKMVPSAEIDHVKTKIGGVYITTGEGSFFTDLTLKLLEERTSLVRCHKQYLIHPDQIDRIRPLENGGAEITTRGHHAVPVSRRYYRALKNQLGL